MSSLSLNFGPNGMSDRLPQSQPTGRSGCANDIDCDGIKNIDDLDVDGDGIPNAVDDDIDGDGLPNEEDSDMDGDGVNNANDADANGDGIRDKLQKNFFRVQG